MPHTNRHTFEEPPRQSWDDRVVELCTQALGDRKRVAKAAGSETTKNTGSFYGDSWEAGDTIPGLCDTQRQAVSICAVIYLHRPRHSRLNQARAVLRRRWGADAASRILERGERRSDLVTT